VEGLGATQRPVLRSPPQDKDKVRRECPGN
jgi:hypothetical protein